MGKKFIGAEKALKIYAIAILLVMAAMVFVLPQAVWADDGDDEAELVRFTVHYQDESGDAVAEPHVFYGKAGEKPDVVCLRIEGYEPVELALTKTLSENESENIFTFVYSKSVEGDSAAAASVSSSSEKKEEDFDIDKEGPLAQPGEPYEGKVRKRVDVTPVFAVVCGLLIAGFIIWRQRKKKEIRE